MRPLLYVNVSPGPDLGGPRTVGYPVRIDALRYLEAAGVYVDTADLTRVKMGGDGRRRSATRDVEPAPAALPRVSGRFGKGE